MKFLVQQIGKSHVWVKLGSVDIYFLKGAAAAFVSPTGSFKRSILGELFDFCEELEDDVFECRLEEAIVNGLVADD